MSTMSIASPDIVVVGSANYDLFSYSERLPAPGETVKGVDFKTSLGGKGANQAVMAARLYPKDRRQSVALICNLGSDNFGQEYYDFLTSDGLATTGVIRLPNVNTGIAQINVATSDGENTIVITPGANGAWTANDLKSNKQLQSLIQNCKVILLQNEIPIEATLEALRIAKSNPSNKIFTIFSPAPAQSDFPQELFDLSDLVLCNRVEGLQILGRTEEGASPEEVAKCLLKEKKCGAVIMSLGSDGCIVVTSKATTAIPATFVEKDLVVDTVGAGDAFAGALGYFVGAHGLDLEEAARRAGRIASFTIQKKGATTSYPTREEIYTDQVFNGLN